MSNSTESDTPTKEWERHPHEPRGCPTPGACSAAETIATLIRERDEARAEGRREGLREAHDLCAERARSIAEASTTTEGAVRAQQEAHASEAWACCNAVYCILYPLDVIEEPE